MNKEKLWQLVLNGSPLTAAMALVLLDRELDGKISRVAKRISKD